MNYTLTRIPISDYEYKDKLINSSNICIHKIHNEILEQKYQNFKISCESEMIGYNELVLYHGTKPEYCVSILTNGFQKKYNKLFTYGKGTYFATNYDYSCLYTGPISGTGFAADNFVGTFRIFVCNVIILENITNNKCYDSLRDEIGVNNLDKPTIYVTPYDEGCIPRYLLCF